MNTHPLDEMWGAVDNELPGDWKFDGVTRGLMVWVATAVNYKRGAEHRISASSESPIDAIRKMIEKVRFVDGKKV